MQDRLVAAVGEAGQKPLFILCRIGEHRQRLIGMGGDDDMIETLRAAGPFDGHAAVVPRHSRDGRVQD